jgi:hypothetical protein
MLAVTAGNMKLTTVLLDRGADIDIETEVLYLELFSCLKYTEITGACACVRVLSTLRKLKNATY